MNNLTRIQKIIAMKPAEKKAFIDTQLTKLGYPDDAKNLNYRNKKKINSIIYFIQTPFTMNDHFNLLYKVKN